MGASQGPKTAITINNSTNTTTELLVTAPISGTAGAVIKAGDGTMALNATNTYTGATTVNAGVLQVGVAGVGTTGAGATTVNSTGTLAGTGTVSAAATIASGGTIAPGDLSGSSIGTINLGGGLTIQNSASASLGITTGNSLGVSDKSAVVAALAGGTYTGIEAAIGLTNLNTYNTGIGAGASYDLINVTGSFSMANATFTVNDQSYISGGSPQIGHIFNLIDWTTVGTFTGFNVGTGLVLPDLSSLGLGWDTTAFTSHGIIVVVPEPSRAILLLLGLLGLMMRRRRQTV
jgi:autotransporter-associated beta strand protein